MKKFLLITCIAIIVLNVFDYISTSMLLKDNITRELNPVMAWVMSHVGVKIGMLITKIPFLSLLCYATYHARRKVLTKREAFVLPIGYSTMVIWYGVCMYFFNFRSLMEL